MAKPSRIRVKFDNLASNYPTYNALPPDLKKFMDDLNTPPSIPRNTPCCVQMSHALNRAGQKIPARSYRRHNSKIGTNFYILAVDELERHLSYTYGWGEEINRDAAGKVRTLHEMKAYLGGKQGILLFRNGGAGHHTELWDQTHIMQDGNAISGHGAKMDEKNIFGQPRVVFWEAADSGADLAPMPEWLQGWWQVYDGTMYYYFFSDQYVATYTKTAPKNLKDEPQRQPLNEGDVTISPDGKTVVINWNPADGGETVETFTRTISAGETMSGVSNRFMPLTGTKMYETTPAGKKGVPLKKK